MNKNTLSYKVRSAAFVAVHMFTNYFVAYLPFLSLRRFFYRALGMKIGKGVFIAMGVRCLSPWKIEIGDNSVINRGVFLVAMGGIRIGANVNITWDAYIITSSHDIDSPDFRGDHKPISIGDYSWISTRSIVLSGVTVHEGAVVAAGAVLARDAPPYTVMAGNPATPVRERKKVKYKLTPMPFFDLAA